MTDLPHILWRSVLAFIVLIVVARAMGKKQISQLTFFDYVVGITIGSTAADMSLDLDAIPVQNAIATLVIWSIFPILIAWLSTKSYHFRHLVDGKPTVLVQDGKIQEKNLKKERMTSDELMHLLREKSVFHLADVEFAVMEIDGKLSVLQTTESQPMTAKMQGFQVENEHEPRIVIMDGNVMEQTLQFTGHTEPWLQDEVKRQGATSTKDVFLAQVDAKGNLYVDLYLDEQKIQPSKPQSVTAAALKKVQADLELNALQTNVPHAKHLYAREAKQIEKILERIEPYLNK